MIAFGMWIQAVGICLIAGSAQPGRRSDGTFLAMDNWRSTSWSWTALVYPTLLAAIGDVVEPGWRASAVGVYRLWRAEQR